MQAYANQKGMQSQFALFVEMECEQRSQCSAGYNREQQQQFNLTKQLKIKYVLITRPTDCFDWNKMFCARWHSTRHHKCARARIMTAVGWTSSFIMYVCYWRLATSCRRNFSIQFIHINISINYEIKCLNGCGRSAMFEFPTSSLLSRSWWHQKWFRVAALKVLCTLDMYIIDFFFWKYSELFSFTDVFIIW